MASRVGYWLFAGLAVLSAACDRGTKLWAEHALVGRPPVEVVRGFWDFRLTHNSGLAFSLLPALPTARLLVTLAGAVVLLLLLLSLRRNATRLRACVGLALVAGGAVGNLYDRMAYGRVTDFIHWHWRAHEWPVFNVADALLLVGAALLLWSGGKRASLAA